MCCDTLLPITRDRFPVSYDFRDFSENPLRFLITFHDCFPTVFVVKVCAHHNKTKTDTLLFKLCLICLFFSPLLVKPEIVSISKDVIVNVADDISLACVARGNPTPVITWIKDEIRVTNGNRFTVQTSGELSVREAGRNDEGNYQCVAKNDYGSDVKTVRVTVRGEKLLISLFFFTLYCPLLFFGKSKNIVSVRYFTLAETSRKTWFVWFLSASSRGPGDKFVNSSIVQAKQSINRAIQTTIQRLFAESKPRSPSDLLALFRFPNKQAIEIARAAEVSDVMHFACLRLRNKIFLPWEKLRTDQWKPETEGTEFATLLFIATSNEPISVRRKSLPHSNVFFLVCHYRFSRQLFNWFTRMSRRERCWTSAKSLIITTTLCHRRIWRWSLTCLDAHNIDVWWTVRRTYANTGSIARLMEHVIIFRTRCGVRR